MKRKSTISRPTHDVWQEGGTTVAVLGFIVVISLIFSSVLFRSMDTYRQVSHIASWQESLLAAESGSDTAMAALRKSLVDPAAFADWTKTAEDGTPLPNGAMTYACPQLVHGGEGNTQIDAKVIIDAPSELRDASDRQWYRIRSSGTTILPGPARPTADKRDHLLRRLAFVRDRKTGQQVARPQSTRLVELLVKPTSFENAIVSDLPMALNNHKIVIDSYDSRSEDKSTAGLYDPAKRLQNGDIATNSRLIDAGDAQINGDAYTNAGTIENGANITGEQRDDFFQDLTPIKAPTTWTTIEFSPSRVQGNVTLTGGTKDSPKRYKLDSMSIAGTEVVTFAPSAPGVESYVEIWLTGDLKATGSGTISVLPNTNVTIYLEGNIDIKGNGTFNANSQPGRLQILGVEPPPGEPPRTMNFSGNGVIVAAIYGPDHDVVFGATGAEGTMWGSLTGKSITMGGTTYIHYDEALADTGYITDYKIQSWFEDNK
jgi:hypothetical protein